MRAKLLFVVIFSCLFGCYHADSLEISGNFTQVGNFFGTSYARFNGWYWDLNYHVKVNSGSITCICKSQGYSILGGDFELSSYYASASYLAVSNGWFSSDMSSQLPIPYVFAPPFAGGQNPGEEDEGEEEDGGFSEGGFAGGDEGGDEGGAGTAGGDEAVALVSDPSEASGFGYTETQSQPSNKTRRAPKLASSSKSKNLDGPVFGLNCFYSQVMVVGNFTSAGDTVLNNVGLWDIKKSSWKNLVNGTNGPVYAVTAGKTLTYIGGSFSIAGGQEVSNLAAWNQSSSQWMPLGLCIDGVVQKLICINEILYIAGDFSLCDGSIQNFVIFDGQMVNNTEGINGTIRTFYETDKGELIAGGNFNSSIGDEIRMWNGSAWDPFTKATFNGKVLAVAADSVNHDAFVVGGDFMSMEVDGIAYNFSFLVTYDSKNGWQPMGNLNGKVDVILSSNTSNKVFLILGCVSVGLFLVCLAAVGCKQMIVKKQPATETRRLINMTDEVESLLENKPAVMDFKNFFLVLLLCIGVSCALNASLLAMSKHIMSGVLRQFVDGMQSLLLISHLWLPALRVDVLIGFIASVPILCFPVLIHSNFKATKEHSEIDNCNNMSPKARSTSGHTIMLLSFILWVVVFLFYLLATPLPNILAQNSLVISILLSAFQLLASILLSSALDTTYVADNIKLLLISVTVQISMRLTTAALLAISPAITTAISVFVPAAPFAGTYALLLGNHLVQNTYFKHSKEPAGFIPRLVLLMGNLFSVKNTRELNDEYICMQIFKQLLIRIVDFYYLSGYSTITPFMLFLFTVVDLRTLRKVAVPTQSDKYLQATIYYTLVACFALSAISPGLFVSKTTPVYLTAIFSVTLVSLSTFAALLTVDVYSYILANGMIVLFIGIGAYITAWFFAGCWAVFVPLFAVSFVLLVALVCVIAKGCRE